MRIGISLGVNRGGDVGGGRQGHGAASGRRGFLKRYLMVEQPQCRVTRASQS